MTLDRHEHPHDLLGPAALGLLTSREQRTLDQHLDGCARCRDELATLKDVTGRLAALEPEDAETLQLGSSPLRTDRILAEIGSAAATERRRGRRLQSVLGTAASVSVLIAGLVTAGALNTDQPADVPLESVAIAAPAGVDASADLVAHTWGVEIKLRATGLQDGRAYSVQVLTTDGRVTDAGAFIGTGERTLDCNLNTSVLRPEAESFTVFDEGGTEVLTADL
jgi:hypothetical protein